MNLSTNIVVTAVLLLVLSGGLLYPIHSSIGELETAIVALEASPTSASSPVPERLAEVNRELERLHVSLDARGFELCPDTPEARNEMESLLHTEMMNAGLTRVSMDRQAGSGTGAFPSFNISLIVEGDAFELHAFLQGLESLKWVTRVLKLEIQPGDVERRIKMQIAVLLENKP